MKSEEIKKLVAKSENAAVEFKRAKGITAAQAGLANRASQAERKRVPSDTRRSERRRRDAADAANAVADRDGRYSDQAIRAAGADGWRALRRMRER